MKTDFIIFPSPSLDLCLLAEELLAKRSPFIVRVDQLRFLPVYSKPNGPSVVISGQQTSRTKEPHSQRFDTAEGGQSELEFSR
jgi:hypothetical protein